MVKGKGKGKGKAKGKNKTPTVIEGISTEEMTKEQVFMNLLIKQNLIIYFKLFFTF